MPSSEGSCSGSHLGHRHGWMVSSDLRSAECWDLLRRQHRTEHGQRTHTQKLHGITPPLENNPTADPGIEPETFKLVEISRL